MLAPPPTYSQASQVVHYAYDLVAQIADGHVAIGGCPRVGRHSRACGVRITGDAPQRLRVVVTNVGQSWIVSARDRA